MKLFVWDLHGVLESGNEAALLEQLNSVLEMDGYSERFGEKDVDSCYGLKLHEYFSYILPRLGLEECLKLSELFNDFSFSNPQIISSHIRPTDFSYDVLSRIAKNAYQILVSNADAKSVKFFLGLLKMGGGYFREVLAVGDYVNGVSKKDVFSRFMAGKDFESIVTIGDSPSDMELKKVSPNSVSYLYAHPGRAFRECKADYRIRDLREVLREL